MLIQVSKIRRSANGVPIIGWKAEDHACYPYLMTVLQELKNIDTNGVTELGADHEDERLIIVWSYGPAFTNNISPRGQHSWICRSEDSMDYIGIDITGTEFRIPISNPNSAKLAANALVFED